MGKLTYKMGFIKHFDGRLKDGSLYVGWVDSKQMNVLMTKRSKGVMRKIDRQ